MSARGQAVRDVLAFVGPRPAGCAGARHLNGIQTDNRLENLAWGTAAENSAGSVIEAVEYKKLAAAESQLLKKVGVR